MVLTFILLSLLGVALCQTKSLQCGEVSRMRPTLTMQFTPSMPTQIPPISTVYGALLTSYMNVVDCNYVMVENIDSNPAQVGHFTEKTTIPVMTVYRVGCMPETTAVTRRDLQAYQSIEPAHPQTELAASFANKERHIVKRTEGENQVSPLKSLYSIAERLSMGVDPTNENITVRDFKFLEQLNTALFALNVVKSGLPLNETCTYLQDSAVQNDLAGNIIDAQQAADIVCFAAKYGLYFNESNEKLLADLAALEFAIQVHGYNSESLQRICEDLDYIAASFLGVDTDGIRTYVCNGTGPPAHPTSSESTSSATSTATGVSPTGFTGTAPPMSTGTGDVSTGTTSGTVSIIFGTSGPAVSSATSAAGTLPPWWNGTSTTTADVTSITSGGHRVSPTMTFPVPHYYPPRLRRHGRGSV